MPPLYSSITRLAANKRLWTNAIKGQVAQPTDAGTTDLREITDFGANPAALRMFAHVPPGLPAHAPLVVALHGCTQNAQGYDVGTGWSGLATAHDFAVVLPEQTRANNANLCFNWFSDSATARGMGEVASIAAMVGHMIAAHRLDPRRVYVTGLSAGGAMAMALLASYPDLFAGGAILAGLPFGIAHNVQKALELMFNGTSETGAALAARVHAASPAWRGPWPRLSVWQGDRDTTVVPANADAILRQWAAVQGLPDAPTERGRLGSAARDIWRGPDGRIMLERVLVPGMAHGAPVMPGAGTDSGGESGAHFLASDLFSSVEIGRFWDIVPHATAPRAPALAEAALRAPAEIIKAALRKAGLG